mmetsp:Transcript_57568/g.106367  ORF Transcript_57568/g.106367 Transcript_57568/m.106367 type:complete len:383 (+) Transcript_57568:32-1180(+)
MPLDAKPEDLTQVDLPAGWEGLSFKVRGGRCIVSEVPKACFSSAAFGAKGAKPQVDGVAEGDEIVTINGETPKRTLERIMTAGDSWNACSNAEPSHAPGSKTKFDSPPCAACDCMRRQSSLGFDVALQMWMRAVKRELKITLGVRASANVPAEPLPESEVPVAVKAPAAAAAGNKLERSDTTSSVVNLQASSESASRMQKALEKLAKLDDANRKKVKKQEQELEKASGGKGKGKGKKGKGKRPSGPNLPRTRLTTDLVIGEAVEWKGKYGWIKPVNPVDHPKASMHKGRLYIHVQDLEWWVKEIKPGSWCRFHVYSDANSLGAEECTVLDENSASWTEDKSWDNSWGADASSWSWGDSKWGDTGGNSGDTQDKARSRSRERS